MLLILAFSTAFLVDETLAILRRRLAVEALDWPRRSVKHNAEVIILSRNGRSGKRCVNSWTHRGQYRKLLDLLR